uniref:Uncharacterized protein n=1 Tax=Rhizophora mucronata TaxID=61149 RepID=A0A2P2NB99_RHIMU
MLPSFDSISASVVLHFVMAYPDIHQRGRSQGQLRQSSPSNPGTKM